MRKLLLLAFFLITSNYLLSGQNINCEYSDFEIQLIIGINKYWKKYWKY